MTMSVNLILTSLFLYCQKSNNKLIRKSILSSQKTIAKTEDNEMIFFLGSIGIIFSAHAIMM